METLQLIREGFAYFRTSPKRAITLKEKYYWVVKIDGMQGIAIKIPKDKHVNEKFSSIAYYTREYLLDGKEYNLLLLVSDYPKLYDDFALICAAFLEKVLDGESYQEIQANPISWWYSMKELLGNANVEKLTYSVIAELMSYYYLLKEGENVSWAGPFGGSIDLECSSGSSYEVKSTVARYGSQITINSQYQLRANYLLFYRFEPSVNGISIQHMVDKLIEVGADEGELEQALEKLNYPVGSESREKSYQILEAMKYLVNEDFPKITLENFKNEQLPKHIIGLTYTLDLEGLESEALDFGLVALKGLKESL